MKLQPRVRLLGSELLSVGECTVILPLLSPQVPIWCKPMAHVDHAVDQFVAKSKVKRLSTLLKDTASPKTTRGLFSTSPNRRSNIEGYRKVDKGGKREAMNPKGNLAR